MSSLDSNAVSATEYHEDDFDWEEHARECEPIVRAHYERRLRRFLRNCKRHTGLDVHEAGEATIHTLDDYLPLTHKHPITTLSNGASHLHPTGQHGPMNQEVRRGSQSEGIQNFHKLKLKQDPARINSLDDGNRPPSGESISLTNLCQHPSEKVPEERFGSCGYSHSDFTRPETIEKPEANVDFFPKMSFDLYHANPKNIRQDDVNTVHSDKTRDSVMLPFMGHTSSHLFSFSNPSLGDLPMPIQFSATQISNDSWESFYQHHHTSKVYQERRYLLLEFAVLRTIGWGDLDATGATESTEKDNVGTQRGLRTATGREAAPLSSVTDCMCVKINRSKDDGASSTTAHASEDSATRVTERPRQEKLIAEASGSPKPTTNETPPPASFPPSPLPTATLNTPRTREGSSVSLKDSCRLPNMLPSKLIVEIGCGHGSSLIPILLANPRLAAVATDVSATSLTQLTANARRRGLTPLERRLPLIFACDGSSPDNRGRFEGLEASAVLLIFALSALPPAAQLEMVRNAAAALRPGGLVLVRDHGLYDMAQMRHCTAADAEAEDSGDEGGADEEKDDKGGGCSLRCGDDAPQVDPNGYVAERKKRSTRGSNSVPSRAGGAVASTSAAAASEPLSKKLAQERNLYAREGEGTLAYFFSVEAMETLAESAGGLQVRECRYARVENVNRRTGRRLRRVFVHAVFEKVAGPW